MASRNKCAEQFVERPEQDMMHSAFMAVAFNVAAVIFHDPFKMPAQNGTILL